jgi:hypothetical protein
MAARKRPSPEGLQEMQTNSHILTVCAPHQGCSWLLYVYTCFLTRDCTLFYIFVNVTLFLCFTYMYITAVYVAGDEPHVVGRINTYTELRGGLCVTPVRAIC